jgi:hypothetical protein
MTALAVDCPPLFATPRDPTRATLGGAVATVATQLGTPLMPWQRLVADVAMELDPATGLLAYSEVDLTTPRQSGKTTLELAVLVHRCRTWARSRALYSAQSRIHAHKKWEDEHVATLKRSPFADEFAVRYQRGDEADWRALADADSSPVEPVAFAADVTPDRAAPAIGVAGLRADGLEHAEVVDHRPGTRWVVARLVDLHGCWRPCAVVVDDTGPAGSLIAPLEAAGVEVVSRPPRPGPPPTAASTTP